jgi:hypothetical protein
MAGVPGLPTAVAQGAITGAGSNPEDRLGGAVAGGVMNAAGYGAGKVVGDVLGAATRGVSNLQVPRLVSAGVPMTVGDLTQKYATQLAERGLSKLPIAGAALRKRQSEAVLGLNRATFDEVLKPIGQTTNGEIGDAGVRAAQDHVTDAFTDALKDIEIAPTPGFRDKVAGIISTIGKSDPQAAASLNTAVAPIVAKDTITGADVQHFMDEVNNVTNSYRQKPGWAVNVRPHTEAANTAMIDLLESGGLGNVGKSDVLAQIDASAMDDAAKAAARKSVESASDFSGRIDQLNKAKQAYRGLKITEAAVADSLPQGGVFKPQTLYKHVTDNIKDYEGTGALAAGKSASGKQLPLLDLSREGLKLGSGSPSIGAGAIVPTIAGADVLYNAATQDKKHPNTTSDFVRDALLLAAGGAGANAFYSKATQRALASALTRGGTGSALGDMLYKYALPSAGGQLAMLPVRGGDIATMPPMSAGAATLLPPPSRTNMPAYAPPPPVPDMNDITGDFGYPVGTEGP